MRGLSKVATKLEYFWQLCHRVTVLAAILPLGPHPADPRATRLCMMNTYEATIRLPSGGLQKVEIKANSWAHARDLLTMQYGSSFMNLHQKS